MIIKCIMGIASFLNLIGFIAEAGYGVGLWNDPKLNAGIICSALIVAAVYQFEWATGR